MIDRLEGIKKMKLWHQAPEEVIDFIKVLEDMLEIKKLKTISYVNGNKDRWNPTLTLMTVREDLERPLRSSMVNKEDIITYHKFRNTTSKGTGSKQFKIILEILEEVVKYGKI